MKTSKETVYEYIEKESYQKSQNTGFTTMEIASSLGLLRTNASTILNDLVKEGLLVKTESRPVYYQLFQENETAEERIMEQLIGYNGSLHNAVQLATAAILYPKKSLNVLLCSKTGCGTTSFAGMMVSYAREKKIVSPDSPYIKINCRHYMKNISSLNEAFFGTGNDLKQSCFYKAKGGVLFLDNVDLLEARQQGILFTFLESGMIYSDDRSQSEDCRDLILIVSCSPGNSGQFNRSIPVQIELPELKDRPLQERFDLINHFFSIEASNSSRSIEVDAEVIKALLLTEYPHNVKELEFDIRSACANAYVRVVNDPGQDIFVCLDDFNGHIRRSLLKLKEYASQIEAVTGTEKTLYYDEQEGYQEPLKEDGSEVYSQIKKQYEELSSLGVNDQSIDHIMNTHIQNLFEKYNYYQKMDYSGNMEQLSKIVDHRVIDLVTRFLKNSGKPLERTFKSNVFCGLCLHINSLLTQNFAHQRVSNDQIVRIIQDYPTEYAFSVQFCEQLKETLGLDLPIHEVILITMFLIESDEENEEYPVLLYIMHGNNTASSLKEVTNSLTHCDNVYAYDLKLDMDTSQAMEQIKKLLIDIDNGKGIIVIYDMGSIKTMLDTIQEELNIKIRYINMPVTLLGIDISRRCSMENDIDYVYHMANLELNNFTNRRVENKVIVTLCHTGEGGAQQLKRYIDQYSKLGIRTVALSISVREELLNEIMNLQKTYHIHAFVGTYDPKLMGVPFIPIGKIFENSKEDLDRILMFEPVSSHSFDYKEVYEYLQDQLKYVSINKLKTVLPDIIDEFTRIYVLTEDQKVGLFMHLACLMERLMEGKASSPNHNTEHILKIFSEDYQIVRKLIRNLEKTFKVIVDDHELATLIMIVKKL